MLASKPVCRVIADAQEVRFAVAREHACQPAGAGVCQTASAVQAARRKLAQEVLDLEMARQIEAEDQVRAHMCVSSHAHTHTHTHTYYECIHLSFCMLCIYVLNYYVCDRCMLVHGRACTHMQAHTHLHRPMRIASKSGVCVCLSLAVGLPARLCALM